jgi:hypothetical protein
VGGNRRKRQVDQEHPRFAEWYAAYPAHKEPGAASDAFTRAVAKGADPQDLIDAAKRYCDDPTVRRGYIKNPATWLNKKCWLDEATPTASASDGYRPYQNPTDQSVYDEDL